MSDEQSIIENYSDLVNKVVISYNKGIVLDFITRNSFQIIYKAMEQLQIKFNTILTAFEEIQQESSSSAANTARVDSVFSGILKGRKQIQQDIHEHVGEIKEAALTAQDTAASFAILKERTVEVKTMLAEIQEVSIKTGILAINASIEAARAGKAGDSFRIIANEVRTLSTQTGEFAKTIDAKLAELQSSVNDINNSMSLFISLFSKFQKSFNGILNNFDKNSSILDEAGESLAEIASSIKEEDITIRDGFASLKSIEGFLKETGAILDVVQTSHSHLEHLLQQS